MGRSDADLMFVMLQPPTLSTSRNRVALEMPRNGGVSFIRIWSPSPETGDWRGIPVSVSEADSLVSLFKQRASRRRINANGTQSRRAIAQNPAGPKATLTNKRPLFAKTA
jgi:hypothetical protein